MPAGNKRNTSQGIFLIAVFKLLKGLVLFAVGLGALRLFQRGVAVEVDRWADIFRVDPNNGYLNRILARGLAIDPRKLREFSVGTFIYSGLLLTEGTGLALRKRWAEYFTIISTSALLPLEFYELSRKMSWPRILVLTLNIAAVIYLVVQVYRNRSR